MNVSSQRIAACFILSACLFTPSILRAEDEPKSSSDATKPVTSVAGVLEAIKSHEIVVGTETLDSFKVKRVLEHGSEVSEGQNLIWFETEEIDEKVKQAETQLRLSRLAQEDAEYAHRHFLKTQALDRALAQRTREEAQQDYDNFMQVDRDRQRVTAEQNLKSSQGSLENALEELEQLEQMYLEDDLTEESEEIVLKRAKRAVESARYRLDGTKISSERSVSQGIPRATAKQEASLARAQLAHDKSLRDLDSARKKREIELEQKREKFRKEERDFEKLRQERKRVVLTSPMDGILVHGPLNRGKLSDKPSALKKGAKVSASQVLATVIDPGKLRIRVDLSEKQLAAVQMGDSCKVKVAAFPEYEGAGTVKSISTVPYAGNKYDCVVSFRPGKNAPTLLPTMSCELVFESIAKAETDDSSTGDE